MSVGAQRLSQLSDALDALRRAVIAGDFERISAALGVIGPTVADMETSHLSRGPVESHLAAVLATIREQADHLTPLILAARAGVDDARSRLSAMQSLDHAATYDSDGQRHRLSARPRGLLRKA